jgi:hypothetical protein
MKIDALDDGHFALHCTREELSILNNALNNIPQAVDEVEYTTLIGATKDEADALLKTIHGALASD